MWENPDSALQLPLEVHAFGSEEWGIGLPSFNKIDLNAASWAVSRCGLPMPPIAEAIAASSVKPGNPRPSQPRTRSCKDGMSAASGGAGCPVG